MQKKQNKTKQSSFEFVKEALTLLGGLAGSIVAVSGLVKTFRDDTEGFLWLIPVGAIIWSVLLWRLFQHRKSTAYSLLIVSILIGTSIWIGWQSQSKAVKDKMVILIARFDGPEEKYGLRDQIMEELHSASKGYDDTVIIDGKEVVTAGQGSKYAQELGKAQNADLVIWAWYKPTDNPNITIHFENLSTTQIQVLQSSETYKPKATLTDLKSFELQQKLGAETKTLISFIAGMVSYQSDDYKTALSHFEPILLEENISTFIEPSTLYFKIAFSHDELGSYERSIEYYSKVIEVDPGNVGAYNNRGVIYGRLKNYIAAIEDFDKSIELNPMEPGTYSNRGYAYDFLKDYDRALQNLNKAIEMDPNNVMAYSNRGGVYLHLEDYNQAIKDYEQAIKLTPDDAGLHNNRGAAYFHLKDFNHAIEDFSKALELDPNLAYTYSNLGLAYRGLGDYENAIPNLNKAIEMDPTDPMMYNNRGLTLMDLKMDKPAMWDFDKAIELDPESSIVYINRGDLFAHLKDYNHAIADYDEALKLDPNNASVFNDRGKAYVGLKNYESAIQDYDKALELDPNLFEVYSNRGYAYQVSGNAEKAEADFKKYLELTRP